MGRPEKDTQAPLRVALVAESFDAATGGAARCAHRLVDALERRGHHVARVGPPHTGGRIRRARGLVRRALAASAGHDLVVSLGKAPGDVLIPQGGVHLAALVASIESERAPLRGPSATLKLITPKQWVFLRIEEQVARRARRVVALSQQVRADMVRYWGLDGARIAVVPNGVCPERFRPPTPRERIDARVALGAGPGERILLFVSHHWRLRGLRPLIHALGRAPAEDRAHERLVVVGRGSGFQSLARRHGVHLDVRGPVADVRSLYHAAEVLCHPTFYDPCSLVTLEALASGLPVLTSRRNGAAELMSGAEGAIVDDPAAPGEIARALTRLRDPDRRRAAQAAARQTALQHGEEAALGRLVAICEDTAGRAARAALGAGRRSA